MHSKRKSNLSNNSTLFYIVGLVIVSLLIILWRGHMQYSANVSHLEELKAAIEDARNLLRGYQHIQNSTVASPVIDAPLVAASTAQSANNLQNAPAVHKKDVIIGMAQDTEAKNLAVFCGSFRKVSSADAILFVNTPIPDRHKEIAEKFAITLVPFTVAALPAYMQKYHASTTRWHLIYELLQDPAVRSRYQRVWLADVRDTAFQFDPFHFVSRDVSALHVFKGVESITISQCGWNGGWVRDCFGQEMLNTIGNNNIICSGVSAGSMDAVFSYITRMNAIVTGADKSTRFPTCERNGVDQGAHNVLVHTNKLENAIVWSQHNSPVANMQAKLAGIRDNRVFNTNGDEVAVVHQYDRFPQLQTYLFNMYVYWIDTSNPLSEWKAEPTCGKYELVTDQDLFKGVCDLKLSAGTSPSSCCDICNRTPGCQAFTFFSGKCFMKTKCAHRNAVPTSGAFSAYIKQ